MQRPRGVSNVHSGSGEVLFSRKNLLRLSPLPDRVVIRSKPYGDNKDHQDSFTFSVCSVCCDLFETHFKTINILLT